MTKRSLTTSQILALPDVEEDNSDVAKDPEREKASLLDAADQLERAGHVEKAQYIRDRIE